MYLRTDYELKVLDEPGTIVPLKKEADPFSLESLVAWLEKQDPATEYDFYCSDGGCLLSQYAYAHGLNGAHYSDVRSRFYAGTGEGYDWNSGSSRATRVAIEGAWTFGAALTRAQAAIERLS